MQHLTIIIKYSATHITQVCKTNKITKAPETTPNSNITCVTSVARPQSPILIADRRNPLICSDLRENIRVSMSAKGSTKKICYRKKQQSINYIKIPISYYCDTKYYFCYSSTRLTELARITRPVSEPILFQFWAYSPLIHIICGVIYSRAQVTTTRSTLLVLELPL